MATSKPLWRRGLEAADRVAAPVLEGATNHEAFPCWPEFAAAKADVVIPAHGPSATGSSTSPRCAAPC